MDTLAPGASYPLPTEPPEVSKITFEAKTDVGSLSKLTLFVDGSHFVDAEINQFPDTTSWDLGVSLPVTLLTLTNTGEATVYIRNLMTEE